MAILKFNRIALFLGTILFGTISSSVCATEDPIAMLQGVTSRVMSALRKHRAEMNQNPQKLYALVESVILPHVDFSEMARWVVGRNAWKAADSHTQNTFIHEFKILVVRSYARSLLQYTEQKIEFLPFRGSLEGKTRAKISSLVQDSQSSIRMDYHLIREDNIWRVYDIIIEGVSLMQGYRAQFADDIRDGGLEKVIQKMRQHNQ